MKLRNFRIDTGRLMGQWRSPQAWLWLVAILVLPQVPFWLAGMAMPMQRAAFNLDLVLGALLLCWSRPLGLAVMLGLVGLDVMRAASLIYHFATPAEMLSALRFAGLVDVVQIVSWPMVLSVAAIAAAFAVLTWAASRLPPAPVLLLAVAPLFWAADALNGSSQVFGLGADKVRSSINIVGSAGWNVFSSWKAVQALKSRPMQPVADPKAYQAGLRWIRENPGQSVLVVLVESLGRVRSEAVDAWLRGRLITSRIAARWRVVSTDEAFAGSTTRGELRTLCGLNGHYSRLTPADAAACLPHQVAGRLEVFGLHGFTMNMFDRADWWPRIGLHPWKFAEDLPRGCSTAFPGVCDAAVIRQAMALVDAPNRFVYALTLDTHLPLPPAGVRVPDDLQPLCDADHVPVPACELVAQLGRVLSDVEEGLPGLGRAPLVVVVGDHAPPFIGKASRDAFHAERVPLIILEPRDTP